MGVLTNDTSKAKDVIIETFTETIQNMLKEWARVFGAKDDVHWALSKVIDELEKYTTDYKPWSWAIEQLVDGEAVRWRNWARDSYIVCEGYHLERYSVIDGKTMHMNRFDASIDKYTQDGWVLYEIKE